MSFQWTEELSTGIEDIDMQHKELILHVNTLLAACSNRKGREDVGKFLTYLSEYVAFHFAAEEREMIGGGYPGLEQHEEEHEAFKKRIAELKRSFLEQGASTPVVLMTVRSAGEWLVGHIMKTDKKMAGFLRAGGTNG
jgi:hemerythrin